MAQRNVNPQATDTVAEMEVSDPLGQINVALSPLGIYINTSTGWQLVGAPSREEGASSTHLRGVGCAITTPAEREAGKEHSALAEVVHLLVEGGVIEAGVGSLRRVAKASP